MTDKPSAPPVADSSQSAIVGGGPKKILYTLKTVRRIGWRRSAKALGSHNACKACGLGMGGQRGGMTNELDEFPAVCNKSIQAQSTDIQPPIPAEVFDHPLADFKALSGREIETLGRLNQPLFKSPHSDRLQPVSWSWALNRASEAFAQAVPQRSFFYSSGRASNEAGFVLQLLARLYGTNNVNNCSYYCHQATGVGLTNTVGTGTATVALEDLTECDLVFVLGANPASNHPRLLHKLVACRERGGEVIVINPAREPGLVRFAVPKSPKSLLKGGSWVASQYLQPRIGSDIALLTGIGKALLAKGHLAEEFIQQHTQGFAEYRRQLEETDWDSICQATGIDQETILSVAQRYARAERVIFAWGMGMTHHRHGVDNVEAIANLALLRGMVGRPGAGLLPLRGHSNVQGIGTVGVKPQLNPAVVDSLAEKLGAPLPDDEGMDTLACLRAAHAGNMDCALLMGGNLLQATPDTRWAEQAFNRIGFKLYLTTTLNLGHVHGIDEGEALILPVAARDEEWQPTTQESMFNYVRLSDGGIHRLSEARSEVAILCELGKRLLPNQHVYFHQLQNHRNIRQLIAETIPGMEALADIDDSRQEFHVANRLLRKPLFATPSGKAQFVVQDWRAIAQALAAEQHRGEFPLRLMSVRSEGQFNSIIYEESDSYRGTTHRQVIYMNAQDRDALGLQEGDKVAITSAQGQVAGLEVKSFSLPAGDVMMYYPEANALVGRDTDPRSQTPAFKSVAVRIEPLLARG